MPGIENLFVKKDKSGELVQDAQNFLDKQSERELKELEARTIRLNLEKGIKEMEIKMKQMENPNPTTNQNQAQSLLKDLANPALVAQLANMPEEQRNQFMGQYAAWIGSMQQGGTSNMIPFFLQQTRNQNMGVNEFSNLMRSNMEWLMMVQKMNQNQGSSTKDLIDGLAVIMSKNQQFTLKDALDLMKQNNPGNDMLLKLLYGDRQALMDKLEKTGNRSFAQEMKEFVESAKALGWNKSESTNESLKRLEMETNLKLAELQIGNERWKVEELFKQEQWRGAQTAELNKLETIAKLYIKPAIDKAGPLLERLADRFGQEGGGSRPNPNPRMYVCTNEVAGKPCNTQIKIPDPMPDELKCPKCGMAYYARRQQQPAPETQITV